jgi:hypothetical protein
MRFSRGYFFAIFEKEEEREERESTHRHAWRSWIGWYENKQEHSNYRKHTMHAGEINDRKRNNEVVINCSSYCSGGGDRSSSCDERPERHEAAESEGLWI